MKINSLFLGSLLLLVPACGTKKSKKRACHCPAETTMNEKEMFDEKEIGLGDEPAMTKEEAATIDIMEPSEELDESMLMEESPMTEKEYIMGEEEAPVMTKAQAPSTQKMKTPAAAEESMMMGEETMDPMQDPEVDIVMEEMEESN